MVEKERERLKGIVFPPSEEVNAFLEKYGSTLITTGIKASEMLKRPEIT